MYFINLSKHNLVVMTSLVMLVLSGCSSTTKPSEVAATNQKGTRISAEELAQLKASSQQWQSAKEGVERLLIIEEDLKLLISQLNAVVKQEGDSNEAVRSVTISPLKKVEEKPQTAITKPRCTFSASRAWIWKRTYASSPAEVGEPLSAVMSAVKSGSGPKSILDREASVAMRLVCWRNASFS